MNTVAKKKNNKPPKLTLEMKQQVENLFEPLLSVTFGGDNYKRYSLEQAKQLTSAHITAALQALNTPLAPPALIMVHHTLHEVQKVKSLLKLLELISEMCLLEEDLE